MGNNRRKRYPPFVMLYHSVIDSPAWRALGHPAVRAYLHLLRKRNGQNDENLSLTYAEMEPYMHRSTFSKAMRQLVECGFIKVIRHGGLMKQCNLYGLSDEWKWYGKGKSK